MRAVASGWACPNDRTAEWVRRDPDRIIGFAAIDPMEDDHLEELERGVEDLGLRGVKLYPVLGRYSPADPLVFPLYAEAQRRDLPVLLHVGTHPQPNALLKHSLPLLIDEVAQVFPDLRIVIAHMAHPWQRECAVVLRKHPNVYADVSGGGWVRPYQAWQALVLMCELGRDRQAALRLRLPALDAARGDGGNAAPESAGRGHQPSPRAGGSGGGNHSPGFAAAAGIGLGVEPAHSASCSDAPARSRVAASAPRCPVAGHSDRG